MRLLAFFALAIAFTSCQKEIDWGLGSGGGTNGDLLTRALEITPATNDTTQIDFTWDAQRRLTRYEAHGEVNALAVDISHQITRGGDGKIQKIVSDTGIPMFDSIVYRPTWSGEQVSYVKSTNYNAFFQLEDSSKFTYNGSGQITEIVTYTNLFGTWEATAKRVFTYTNSNVSSEETFAPDGMGGFESVSLAAYTYNTHKSAVKLGVEAFIIFPPTTAANNDLDKEVRTSTLVPAQTRTITGQTYNSNDRPVQISLAITPQPPGYNIQVKYFYQ